MKMPFQLSSRGPREIIGVDISEGRITVVEIAASHPSVVKNVAVKEISDNASDEELITIIQALFAGSRLLRKEVWLNLDPPPQVANYSRISLPAMPEQELPEAVKWNLKDRISLELDNTQLQYESSGELQKEDGSKSISIMAAAVEKSVIERFLNIFKNAGIALSGINVTPFSLANVLRLDNEISKLKGPVFVCNIGLNHSYICMYVNGRLDFLRQIPLAEETFLNAMTGVFMSDKGRLSLGLDEAKKIIEEFGIPKETDQIMGGQVSASQITSMIRPVLERFLGEILRSIDYCQKEFNYERIEKVLLTGQGSYMNGLSEFISKELAMQIGYLPLPKNLKSASAFGVAAGYKGIINFVPEEMKQKKGQDVQKGALRVTTTAVLGVLLFLFLSSSLRIANYEHQLAILKSQKLLLKDFKEMQDRIDAVQGIVDSVIGHEFSIDGMLEDLSVVTPGNIAFMEVWINRKQRILMLRGRVSAKPELVNFALSNYTTDLEKAGIVIDANLTGLQTGVSDTGDISTFEIKGNIK